MVPPCTISFLADEKGRSNYRMGALRPNQFGVGDDGVREYVESIAKPRVSSLRS